MRNYLQRISSIRFNVTFSYVYSVTLTEYGMETQYQINCMHSIYTKALEKFIVALFYAHG